MSEENDNIVPMNKAPETTPNPPPPVTDQEAHKAECEARISKQLAAHEAAQKIQRAVFRAKSAIALAPAFAGHPIPEIATKALQLVDLIMKQAGLPDEP